MKAATLRSGWGRGTALVVAVLLCLFFSSPSFALTIEEERKLAREVYDQIRKQLPFVDDPAVTGYIETLGQDLLKATGHQHFDFRFFVIQNETINAFAMPGGYIYMTSGCMASLENEGQLAAILSHEIGHVVLRHISRRIERNKKLNWATLGAMVAGALMGGAPGAAVMMGSVGANMQAQLAYSRDDEREADRKGMEILLKAGYSAEDMAGAFRKMAEANMHVSQDIPSYLFTHPGLDERIHYAESRSERGNRGRSGEFFVVRNRVVALFGDALRARNFFENALRERPSDAMALHGMALLHHRQQANKKALGLMKQALAADPGNSAIMTDLGGILFDMKDFGAARQILEKAKAISPRNVRTLYTLGRAYEVTGSGDKAILMYQRAIIQDPNHEQALYQMGQIYGSRGEMARAHLYTGKYFQVRGDHEQAMYHLRQASEKAGNAPADVRKEIDQTLKELTEKGPKPPDGAAGPS